MSEKLELKNGFFKRLWYVFCRGVVVELVRLLYRVKAYSRENIPQSGPVLILSNHQSFFDPMLCQRGTWRPFYFIPRHTLLEAKFWGAMIRACYVIPIKRGQADIAAMKTIIEALKQDKAICLFPEGTRTLDGRIGVIKPGFGLISRRTGATIVPMVIDGIYECWPKNQKLPSLGRAAVIYGKPFTPDYIKSKSDEEFAAEITQSLRDLQAELRIKMGKTPFDYPIENVSQSTSTV